MLKDHLEQLIKERANVGQGLGSRNYCTLPPPLGVVEVIHATSQGVS